jgi:hypothetical protein
VRCCRRWTLLIAVCARAWRSLGGLAGKIAQGTYDPLPADVPAGLRQLVDAMLAHKAAQRPSAADVLKNPLLRNSIARYTSAVMSSSDFKSVARMPALHRAAVQAPLTQPCTGRARRPTSRRS